MSHNFEQFLTPAPPPIVTDFITKAKYWIKILDPHLPKAMASFMDDPLLNGMLRNNSLLKLEEKFVTAEFYVTKINFLESIAI